MRRFARSLPVEDCTVRKEGLPINVQVVGKWQAESTILHLASLLESTGTVRNLHPIL